MQAPTGNKSVSPGGMSLHLPKLLGTLQDLHVSVQAALQQVPSTQCSVEQIVPAHTRWQVPLPSQALVPEHVAVAFKSDCMAGMFVQVPMLPEIEQDLQVSMQGVLQQVPSTQWSVEQVAPEQIMWQAPLPSQALVPVHVAVALLSGCIAEMFVQTPRLPGTAHDLQVWLQVESQQYPSTQRPLTHSAADVQV